MNGRVLFMNTWLDCPDEVKRKHELMQQKIQESKAQFWYKVKENNLSPNMSSYYYSLWVKKNKEKLHLIKLDQV